MIQRTSKFLMANLGAEVERVLLWKEKGDKKMLTDALDRARKITERIMQCPSMSARAEEIKILNEVIDDLVNESPRYNIIPSHLRDYFIPFINSVSI